MKNVEAEGLNEFEREALKARTKEIRAKRSGKKVDGEKDLLAAIEAMPEPDRSMGERLHAIIKANAPDLSPKTWYGMPAYANKDGKVVCFFRGADKFKERYLTFGFNQEAKLDEGTMWPIAYAITQLSPSDEQRIAELVTRAVR